jgi:hypothetical protein
MKIKAIILSTMVLFSNTVLANSDQWSPNPQQWCDRLFSSDGALIYLFMNWRQDQIIRRPDSLDEDLWLHLVRNQLDAKGELSKALAPT